MVHPVIVLIFPFTTIHQVKAMKMDGIVVDEPYDVETANKAVDVALNSIGSLMTKKHKHDTLIRVSWKDGVEVVSKKTKMTLFKYKIHEVKCLCIFKGLVFFKPWGVGWREFL